MAPGGFEHHVVGALDCLSDETSRRTVALAGAPFADALDDQVTRKLTRLSSAHPVRHRKKETVLADGYISDDDLDMLHVTDSVEDAVQAMLTPVPPTPPRDPN